MASQVSASHECVGIVLDHLAFESLLSCKMHFSPRENGEQLIPALAT